MLGGCSTPATSDRRGDADVFVRADTVDATADGGGFVDSGTDADTSPPVVDATPGPGDRDAAIDATLDAVTDASPEGGRSDGGRDAGVVPVVQLTGRFLSGAMQARLDALYDRLGVTPRRVGPAEVTAADLRGAVLVAAFTAPPTDWESRATLLRDAVREGSWMLGEVYGPWPLAIAGSLSMTELPWSRESLCSGSFYFLRADSGEESFPVFASLGAWLPPRPPEALDPSRLFASYPRDAVGMVVPLFAALAPATGRRHGYVQYVASFCEARIGAHPWCVDNPARCGGAFGAQDAWVDEFTIGAGRVLVVQAGTHQPGGLQWGETTLRMQTNAVRHALAQVGAR
jgi:hypothetical protein